MQQEDGEAFSSWQLKQAARAGMYANSTEKAPNLQYVCPHSILPLHFDVCCGMKVGILAEAGGYDAGSLTLSLTGFLWCIMS